MDADSGTAAWLAARLADPFFAEALFDQLPDVVFFVKDRAGRYVLANRTLARRCGYARKQDLIGRAPADVFPPELAAGYAAQDRLVITTGQVIQDRLELHLYPNHAPGWCLTHKRPLFDRAGAVAGLAGISRDLHVPDRDHPAYRRVAEVVAYVQRHYAEPLRLGELARLGDMSSSQLERYCTRIFSLSPKQLIMKARLDAATRLLVGDESIAAIAYACGYADHSAFTRQFKATVGVTPTTYRSLRDTPHAACSRQPPG